MDWKEFQDLASREMGKHFGISFRERYPTRFPKRFDMVSPDEQIIGDAKYLTLVHGTNLPPVNFMEIAGRMWMLEHVPAKHKFLVFGNQRDIVEMWLKKYGTLVETVEFYFLSDDGKLELLPTK